MLNAWGAGRTLLVVGGGFSGTLFALVAAAQPRVRVILIEQATRAGRGLAYGDACDPQHLLNVPVARMEVGLSPTFAQWLGDRRSDPAADLDPALDEAEGHLGSAFVGRQLFGAYLAECLETAAAAPEGALVRVRGEAVKVEKGQRPAVHLADGRRLEGDMVVLATGHLPPRPPRCRDAWFYDTPQFVADPWCWPESADLPPDAPVLLIGAGLTMVDVALKRAAQGHRGPLLAVSRHGLLPHTHLPPAQAHAGPAPAAPVLDPEAAPGPVAALRHLRAAARAAKAAGIPWQKVMDAARPRVADVWSRWTLKDKARFLRHGRTLWDVHRHRMAPRIAAGMAALLATGRLQVMAGRIHGFRRTDAGTRVSIRTQAGGVTGFDAATVVNCTGPRSDFAAIGVPVFEDLRRSGLLVPDALGLGIETRDCAVLDRFGDASRWLFALGPLTRPAWWEITAVPEIAAQVHRLAETLTAPGRTTGAAPDRAPRPSMADALRKDFLNIGAGI